MYGYMTDGYSLTAKFIYNKDGFTKQTYNISGAKSEEAKRVEIWQWSEEAKRVEIWQWSEEAKRAVLVEQHILTTMFDIF